MKKCIFLSILLTTVSLFGLVANAQVIRKVKITDVIKMADTSSVPLVVNFFATWCRPCVEELPWFEKLIPNYKDKGVKLLLVSLDYSDDYPKGIAAFAKKKGINSQIVWLDETDANYFCSKIDMRWQGTIPVSLMVNNKQKIKSFYDHQLGEYQLKTTLDKLVGE